MVRHSFSLLLMFLGLVTTFAIFFPLDASRKLFGFKRDNIVIIRALGLIGTVWVILRVINSSRVTVQMSELARIVSEKFEHVLCGILIGILLTLKLVDKADAKSKSKVK